MEESKTGTKFMPLLTKMPVLFSLRRLDDITASSGALAQFIMSEKT